MSAATDDRTYIQSLYRAAMTYVGQGFSVIPLGQITYDREFNKTVKPLIKWEKQPEDLVTRPDQVEKWFGLIGQARGIALATGPSGLLMIDLDSYKPGYAGTEIPDGAWIERGGRGGAHVYLRNPSGARSTAGSLAAGVDTRGDGGLVICAPTRCVMPDGSVSIWMPDRPMSELNAAALPEATPAMLATSPRKRAQVVGEVAEVTDAQARGSLDRLRQEWLSSVKDTRHNKLVSYLGTLTRYRLAQGFDEYELIGEMEREAGEHPDAKNGEEFKSVDTAISWAIGKARETPWVIVEPSGFEARFSPGPDEAPAAAFSADGGDPFAFTDDDYDGSVELPEAVYGSFGGKPLFYPDKVHWLQGESDSGKSWVGLGVVIEVVRAGGTAWVLDYENSRAEFASRLKALGIGKDEMRRVSYVAGDAMIFAELRAYIDAFGSKADMLLLDGVTSALSAMGKSGRDEQEFGQWFDAVPARARMAVCVDHVVKAIDDRRGMAVGTQAKKGRPDVAYEVRCSSPFGRGRDGSIEIVMQKDRHGGIGLSKGDRVRLDVTTSADGEKLALTAGESDAGFFGDPNESLFSALFADGANGGTSAIELYRMAKVRGTGYSTNRKAAMHAAWLEYYVRKLEADQAS